MSSPELSEPISRRLPTGILTEIETIAAASERTRSWVIVRALRRYSIGPDTVSGPML